MRDDPSIRCGLIIYIDSFTTPEPPAPQNVEPPIHEPYEMEGGWIATLADPDGNYFQLVTPMG